MSATRGPRTRMCTTSLKAKTIATPARRLAAASSEWTNVAGKTASRLTAKSAPVAAKACVRRIRATTRTVGRLPSARIRQASQLQSGSSSPAKAALIQTAKMISDDIAEQTAA
jgi:hypothetical protein